MRRMHAFHSITRADEGLRFSMTQIDPDSPARRFNFSVVVDKHNQYHGARVCVLLCE